MNLWRQLVHGLRTLLHRDADDRAIRDEVRDWLEQAEADLVARGRSIEEARRELRLEYGDADTVRENVRAYGWENVVEMLFKDAGYAVRRLRRSPGFTVTAVLTLGLGIGAATAIFSVVDSVLFEPLAFPDADRVVSIDEPAATSNGPSVQVAFGTFRELQIRSRAFDALAVSREWRPTITGDGEPEYVQGLRVSAGYFGVLGIPPRIGPGFDAAHDRVGGPSVAVLSDGLWRRRFGANEEIIGEAVRLDGEPFTVVGVMPPGFEGVPGRPADVWTLLRYDASLPSFDGREWGKHLDMIGRLSTDLEQTRRDLDRIAREPLPELVRPVWASMEAGLQVRPMREAATAGPRPTLLAMLGAAALLLSIACVNVTNLLLARGARRRGELAMRTALGAARSRLVGQLVTESLVLAGLGGILGVGLAWVGVDALVALSPTGLPRLDSIGLDGRAVAFALAVATSIGVAVGLLPALSRRSPVDGLGDGARGASPRHHGTRRALVVAEVALALMLLVGAGLMQRSLQRLFDVPPGFDASRVVVMQVQTAGFEGEASVHRFFEQSLEAVRAVPGVASASWTSQLPLSGQNDRYGVTLEGDLRPGDARGAHRYAVSPGYFETLGIPLLRGRAFDERDRAGSPVAVVVSEAFASGVAPQGDAIGVRVHVGRTDLPWYTIVGVAADVKQESLAADPIGAIYIPSEQWYFADAARWLVARAEQDPTDLVPALKGAVWSVDADQAIVRVAGMQELVTASEAQRRYAMIILEVFALIALALSAIGIYGVVSGSVGDRVREIGVRSALGASRDSIRAMVVRQGMTLALLGIAIGSVGAAVTSSVLATLLFGVSRLDPLTYVAVAVGLAGTAACACWIPAARAARIDPATTLRAD